MTIQRILSHRQAINYSKILANNNFQPIRLKSTKPDDHINDEYQYLQRGQIPMLHFQRSLPRLPIPKLHLTCNRFLAAVHPLIDDPTKYDELKKILDHFCTAGDGPQLQKLLIEHDRYNKHTSYISEPWFDMYLRDRKPLPINYNPVLIMKHDIRAEYNEQLLRTVNLVITSLRFMRSLREEQLEPEVYHMNPKKSDTPRYKKFLRNTPSAIATFVSYGFKAFPLDMSQYQGLFGATRVPEKGKDRIYRTTTSTHVCVMRNGHFYAVNVLDNSGNIEAPQTIINRLKFVLNDMASSKPAEFPLGVLTAENRDKWAEFRAYLSMNHNERALETIDSALFCISLDDNAHFDPSDPVPMVQNMLHGDKNGLINRWFDKSLSLIVCKDGTAGVNFEHSWGDGVAVLRYFNEIYKETIDKPICHPVDIRDAKGDDVSDAVIKIEFHLDDKAKAEIKQSHQNYQATVNSLEMHAMIYNQMNKGFCKKHHVGPDAIMQLGFQLAYLKQNRAYVGTYESCSTAAFRHGRTETVRPCTMDTKEFCDSIVGLRKNATPLDQRQLRDLIVKCSETHGRLIKEAAMGQGFDRHLFGLKHFAEKNKIPLDPLYEHEAFKKINCNILSSSTLTSVGLLAGGFGPVEPSGYGIGYNIQDEFLGTIVTDYASQRKGGEFVEYLRESYDDIRKILETKKVDNAK